MSTQSNSSIFGYKLRVSVIEDDNFVHVFNAGQRDEAYHAARLIAARTNKAVTVEIVRREPVPDVPVANEVFEVTVPVTVKLSRVKGGLKVEATFINNEYPGFFSEAEDAQGVWDMDAGTWGHEDQDAIRDAAWQRLREESFGLK